MGYFSKSTKPSHHVWSHRDHQAYRRKVLTEQMPVSVYFNNENGEWVYSIYIVSDSAYWVTSFKKVETAVKYIKKVGYNWEQSGSYHNTVLLRKIYGV